MFLTDIDYIKFSYYFEWLSYYYFLHNRESTDKKKYVKLTLDFVLIVSKTLENLGGAKLYSFTD